MDPFIAEIRVFAFPYAPRGWAVCNGAQLNITQSTTLYSLLGSTYGGNGTTTFNLPNLQGRAAMHPGNGFNLGQTGGTTTVTLNTQQMPAHTHTMQASVEDGTSSTPKNGVTLESSAGGNLYQDNTSANIVPMNSGVVQSIGGTQAHNNMQPFMAVNFCVALQGTYPTRS